MGAEQGPPPGEYMAFCEALLQQPHHWHARWLESDGREMLGKFKAHVFGLGHARLKEDQRQILCEVALATSQLQAALDAYLVSLEDG